MSESDLGAQIAEAINQSPYKWRTIKGIAKQLSSSDELVMQAINNSSDFVKSKLPNEHGEALYTTLSKYKEDKSIFKRFLGAGANTVSG